MQNTLSVIDLSAIRSNALYVRKLIGNRFFFAVVKADAYGHGAEEVAAELSAIADGFCVATVKEGAALRVGGADKPILVLAPPTDCEDAAKINYYALTASVSGVRSAKLMRGGKCHIALNTGMNRYGCFGEELDRTLSALGGSRVEGVYSHLYAAENAAECARQLAAFKVGVSKVKEHSPGALVHLAASGGILRGGEYLFDGVRCGLMLYGYAPDGFSAKGLKPAMRVYAPLMQETLCTGGGVGYNLAEEDYKRLYTYRLGYADGFCRGVPLGEKTLCMDAFISRERKPVFPAFTDADDYAKRCGTISYEALCRVTARSERVYERRTEIQI